MHRLQLLVLAVMLAGCAAPKPPPAKARPTLPDGTMLLPSFPPLKRDRLPAGMWYHIV